MFPTRNTPTSFPGEHSSTIQKEAAKERLLSIYEQQRDRMKSWTSDELLSQADINIECSNEQICLIVDHLAASNSFEAISLLERNAQTYPSDLSNRKTHDYCKSIAEVTRGLNECNSFDLLPRILEYNGYHTEYIMAALKASNIPNVRSALLDIFPENEINAGKIAHISQFFKILLDAQLIHKLDQSLLNIICYYARNRWEHFSYFEDSEELGYKIDSISIANAALDAQCINQDEFFEIIRHYYSEGSQEFFETLSSLKDQHRVSQQEINDLVYKMRISPYNVFSNLVQVLQHADCINESVVFALVKQREDIENIDLYSRDLPLLDNMDPSKNTENMVNFCRYFEYLEPDHVKKEIDHLIGIYGNNEWDEQGLMEQIFQVCRESVEQNLPAQKISNAIVVYLQKLGQGIMPDYVHKLYETPSRPFGFI